MKECEIMRSLGLPKSSEFIRDKEGKIKGVATRGGSWDYTEEGKKFMSGEIDCDKLMESK